MVRTLAASALLLGVAAPAAQAQASVLGGDAAACTGGAGPAVLATIIGLKDRSGELKLELYPANEQDFLRDDRDLIREGKVFRRVRAPAPASGAVQMCVRVPHPGRYALLFTHNRDGRNKFSIWSDGAGFASNARLGRSRPHVQQATIDVPAGIMQVNIRAQYLHGLSGFGPMND
ncbi:DUF2141 domain-containing protein [Sphingomonas sp.]|uniref:DUF2141 domain-containing protein n=1 Tax=Sphingomonas sp. TaxID=28214 RepID=UPI003CC54237